MRNVTKLILLLLPLTSGCASIASSVASIASILPLPQTAQLGPGPGCGAPACRQAPGPWTGCGPSVPGCASPYYPAFAHLPPHYTNIIPTNVAMVYATVPPPSPVPYVSSGYALAPSYYLH